MSSPKTYNCVFCGHKSPSKSARKRHNRKCDKRADEAGKPWLDAATFTEMYDDLPDGAFFAMAEEHGIQIEDFID